MKTWIFTLSALLLMTGCTPYEPEPEPTKVVKKEVKKAKKHKKHKKYAAVPPPPKKKIKLKEVEDKNFSSDYMYPETDKKSKKKVEEKVSTVESTEASPASTMTNTECITMIGQEKFDKYTQMLGSEAGAVKKCAMLKAL